MSNIDWVTFKGIIRCITIFIPWCFFCVVDTHHPALQSKNVSILNMNSTTKPKELLVVL